LLARPRRGTIPGNASPGAPGREPDVVDLGASVPADITYRRFTADDAEGVFAAACESWHATYANILPRQFIDGFLATHYGPEKLRTFSRPAARGECFFHVAESDDEIIGFCHIGFRTAGAELYRIYLRPPWLHRGIGARLIALGEEWLRAAHVDHYYCYVHRGNELGKRFYLRMGFQHQPDRDRGDEWCLEKRLD
jgi:GNAT superfamily N-acetyltransferase